MFEGIVGSHTRGRCRQGQGLVNPGFRFIILLLLLFVTVSPMSRAWGRGLVLKVNPYADVDWDEVTQYKANLHTHTTNSDGAMKPEKVMDEYRKRGYNALAITDHNRNTWPWTAYDRDPAAIQMLAISGNELSRHHHTLSLFSNYETPTSDLEVALNGVADAGGLAILCHPAMHWVPWYAQASGLKVALAPALAKITEGDFTVETWFRTPDTGRNILMGNYSGGYTGALNLELHTDNRVRVYVQPVKGATVDLNIKAETLGIDTRDGKWHHLAGVRRQGTVYLYLDGRLAGQKADEAGTYKLQGETYFIGRDTRSGSTVLDGDLCQARLWRRALSQEELTALVSGDAISRDELLAEYASSAPKGPFDAKVVAVAPEVILDGPETLQSGQAKVKALHFATADFPTSVSDQAVDWYLDKYRRHKQLVAIEVLNRTRPDREIPLDRQLWDRLLGTLMPDRPVWGVAVDDMHGMAHMGGDWVVLIADKLNEAAARDDLASGQYYFASTRVYSSTPDVNRTPRIERITHNATTGQITIAATVAGKPVSDKACLWIADGQVVHTGLTLDYRNVAGIGAYVRAEITGDGGIALTNPFGFTRPVTKCN